MAPVAGVGDQPDAESEVSLVPLPEVGAPLGVEQVRVDHRLGGYPFWLEGEDANAADGYEGHVYGDQPHAGAVFGGVHPAVHAPEAAVRARGDVAGRIYH